MIKIVERKEFEAKVLKSEKIVLVEFHAPWCAPCKAIQPALDEIAKKYKNLKIFQIDIHESPEIAESYKISAYPTILLLYKGRILERLIGFSGVKDIEDFLERNKVIKD